MKSKREEEGTLHDARTEMREVIFLQRSPEGVRSERGEKEIVGEISLQLRLNGEPVLSLLCLNELLEELTIGFLFTEGIIDRRGDIESLHVNDLLFTADVRLTGGIGARRLDGLRSMTSGCGKGVTFLRPEREEELERLPDGFRMPAAEIWSRMKELQTREGLYRRAGGVHGALLHHRAFTLFAEDIGRHNCVDKIAGMLVGNHRLEAAREAVLVLSGRISSECVTKAVRLGIPVIISRSAPTASAVGFAREYAVTLVGYVRGTEAVLYSGEERML